MSNLAAFRMRIAAGSALILSLVLSPGQAQSYIKVIGQPGRSEAGFAAHRAPTGEMYIGGSVNDSALVQRIDADGSVLWSRSFKPPGQYGKNVIHLSSASNGDLIGCGAGYMPTAEAVESFYFRMDASGTMIWLRYWGDPQVYVRRIMEVDPGQYLLFGGIFDGTNANFSDIITARVDAGSGDLLWLSDRVDQYVPVPYVGDMQAAARLGDSFYGASSIFTNGPALLTRRVSLDKFDVNGTHLQTQYLLYSNTESRRLMSSDLIAVNDSLTMSYFGDINGASTNFSQGLIRMDTLGNIAWARDFNVGGSSRDQNTVVVPAPYGYVVAGRLMGSTPERLFLMGISHSGDRLWTKTYGPTTQSQTLVNHYASNLTALPDGFLLTGAVDQGGGELDLLIIRTDLNGDVECGEVTPRNAITTILPELTFPSPTQQTPYSAGLGSETTAILDGLISDQCVLGIDLGNDTTLCNGLTLDPGLVQGATYEWQDGSTGQTLEATASGTYWVRVSLDCCIASDTIEVQIDALTAFSLGNDTTVCGTGITLSAPPGSWTTQWSDGSTGPELLVTTSGTYWLSLSGGDCTAADTIAITVQPMPTVTIDGDPRSCDGTPVTLTAVVSDADTYVWSDGSSGSVNQVAATGTVWLQAMNQCATVADTVQVTVAGPITLDLGADTLLCEGSSLWLTTNAPGWTGQWSDGSSDAALQVATAGTYWVELSNGGCVAQDTIVVAVLAVPQVTLPPDTTVCGGATLQLAPVLTGPGTLLWSDGAAQEIRTVTVSGSYEVFASNACGSTSDAINVIMVPALDPGLGPDTLLCAGDTLRLDLSGTGYAFVWQDSATGPVYTITEEGGYWVEGTLSGCVERDTIDVAYTDLALLDLGPDTLLCTVDSLVLDLGEVGVGAVWQNNTQGRYHTAMHTGLYVARISNYCGTAVDSIRVSFGIPPLPLDTVDLCPGRKVVLDPGGEMAWTHWSTQDTTSTIQVGEGEFAYVAEDIHGCLHADSSVVRIRSDKDGIVYIPNSFTPDQDGRNDVFRVVGAERGDFAMALFDRWGRELYRSADPNKGWDGTTGGVVTPTGVYVYTVTYRDRCDGNNTDVSTIGHVTLVR